MMTGYLVAGWGEELVGMFGGVPAGLFLGCFLGALVLNCIAGGIVSLVVVGWRILRHCCSLRACQDTFGVSLKANS
jgi:hypothetical protein